MRTPQLSFTYMYLLLLLLAPGGGAVGDPLLTIGLPIIAVAVLAIPAVLVSLILLTYYYRRLVFIPIIAVEQMLCLGYFHTQFVLPFTSNGVYLFTFTFSRRSRGKQKNVSCTATIITSSSIVLCTGDATM